MVCVTCNNGWMCGYDGQVKHLVKDAILGQPDVIDTRAVALLWSMTIGPNTPAGVPERKAGR